MEFAQWAILIIQVLAIPRLIYYDIEGRERKEPQGFVGVMATLISAIISLGLLYYAGAFSQIF